VTPPLQNTRVAGLQMVSGPSVAENLATADKLAAEAASQGAGVVVLPEFFPIYGVSRTKLLAAREPFGNGLVQDRLKEMATRHGLWVFSGSIPLSAPRQKRSFNSTLVINPAGDCVARYDKIHLFAFDHGQERYNEADSIQAGDTPVAVETPFGRVGLSICYDLRFPELYRRLGPLDLLLLPAAFTDATGRAHWEILLRARAIENQCYLLAAAQGGHHANKRVTHGNSMIIDPWGDILDRKGQASSSPTLTTSASPRCARRSPPCDTGKSTCKKQRHGFAMLAASRPRPKG
jgi:nitrilase